MFTVVFFFFFLKYWFSHSLLRSSCSNLKLNSLRISRKFTFASCSNPSSGCWKAKLMPSLDTEETHKHTVQVGNSHRDGNLSQICFLLCDGLTICSVTYTCRAISWLRTRLRSTAKLLASLLARSLISAIPFLVWPSMSISEKDWKQTNMFAHTRLSQSEQTQQGSLESEVLKNMFLN